MTETRPADEIRAQRLENMHRLAEAGHQPFGQAFARSGRLGEIKAAFEEGRQVTAAGRLVSRRDMGKSVFAHLQDASGRFQIYLKKNDLGEEAFEAFMVLDIGDHLGVEGELFTTRTGEPSIKVTAWTLLAKALLPLPEKWHGLAGRRHPLPPAVPRPDRQPEASRELFQTRARIVRELRNELAARGFMEVETPMIQGMAGGAAATPFQTHYDALNTDMYLRIAPELYLKRLLVGGFDKVFELNRNFRNEGLSRSHNPEFTMLEIYEAYGDMQTMKDLVEELVTGVAEKVVGTLKVGTEAEPVDLTRPWRTVTYHELIREKAGADWFDLDLDAARARAGELGLTLDPEWGPVEVTQEVFEKLIEKTLIHPTFVTRLPADLVPLAKGCVDDPSLVDVFELIIGGREIAPGYTELNDPIVQRARFEAQAGGDASKIDEDFLTALEHGMPPAGGMGVGIDRLVMVLTGAEAIRDVILFPQLKPLAAGGVQAEE